MATLASLSNFPTRRFHQIESFMPTSPHCPASPGVSVAMLSNSILILTWQEAAQLNCGETVLLC